jgi:hypothetical protein
MSTKQARAIVDKIQRGNYEASVALIKTFGLIAPGKWPRKKYVTRPNYYWLKPEVLRTV